MSEGKRRTWAWVLGIAGAAVVGIAIGAAGDGGAVSATASDQPAVTETVEAPPSVVTVTDRPDAVTQTQTVTATVKATVTPKPKPKPAPGPARKFGDGTYLVGTDVAVGSYRSTGPRPDDIGMCYWARLRDDSGQDIIANGLTEGPTRFTTKRGEFLEITGCDFVHT